MEEDSNFTIDIKETLWKNFIWIPMLFLVSSFCVMGISAASQLEEQFMKLMGLIFSLFFTMKLLYWVGHPTLVMKPILKMNTQLNQRRYKKSKHKKN